MEPTVKRKSERQDPRPNLRAPREEIPEEELSKLRSLDRFLEKLLHESWREISDNLGGNRGTLEFSGILPLGDPGLLPFMDQPGVFFLLGPVPSLTVLTLGLSQAPMSGAISAKISHLAGRSSYGGNERGYGGAPTYAAFVAMEDEWNLIRPYWALLNRRIGANSAGSTSREETTEPQTNL